MPKKTGSEMSWAGYPPAARVCVICGVRVKLSDGFRVHTERGVASVRHTACEELEAEVQRLRETLAAVDAAWNWIAENHPAAFLEMPSSLFHDVRRAALDLAALARSEA